MRHPRSWPWPGLLRWGLAAASLCVCASAYGDWLGTHRGLAGWLTAAAAVLLSYHLPRRVPDLLCRLPRRTFLLAVLSLAAGVRLAWTFAARNDQVSDFAEYEELSAALASGQGYCVTGPEGRDDLGHYLNLPPRPRPYATAYRPPGTALLGALLYKILGRDPLWMKLANAALGMMVCWILYMLLGRAGDEGAARAAALAWAVYPAAVSATDLFGSELPFTAALLLAALCLGRALENKAAFKESAILGAALALACLLRSVAPFLAAADALTWLLRHGRRRAAALTLAAWAACLAPWTLRNWRVFHEFIPIAANSGEVLAIDTFRLLPDAARADPALRARRERWGELPSEAVQNREGFSLALEHYRLVLAQGASFVWEKWRDCLGQSFGNDEELPTWSLMRASEPWLCFSEAALQRLRALNGIFYLAFWTAALFNLAMKGGKDRLDSPALVFLSIYFLLLFAVSTVVPGQPRYHFSLMPGIIALACLAPNKKSPHL
ncbi:MAG: glycosyltransferase family 39 protein [Elusimicrobia bacterium]|nr:glycosyltransferase family 39 protein [Elusimicrobiota bacterium]